MDILVVSHYGLYENLTFSFLHGQAKAYAALGHRVRVVIPIAYGKVGADGKRFSPALLCNKADGVELFYVRYFSLSRYGEWERNARFAAKAVKKQLPQILQDFSPAYIHAHTLGLDSFVGAMLKDTIGCPLVVTCHGSDVSIPYRQGNLAFLKEHCDRADRVVAISSPLKKKLLESGTTTPVDVILSGFRLENVPAPKEKMPLSFISVGHLVHQKRFTVTLQAFGAIYKKYPSATLAIVGQGGQKEELQALCDQLGVTSAVTFLGEIPNGQVLEEMAKSRFFVLPSVNEGFGIVYLEAMAAGCIAIGTTGEGIADLIDHKINGFLVPADTPQAIVSAVEECLADDALAMEVARRGQQDARNLTWENNARQYLAKMEEMV
jgi:glycosyltransferase involved in cell wall biosynthesis